MREEILNWPVQWDNRDDVAVIDCDVPDTAYNETIAGDGTAQQGNHGEDADDELIARGDNTVFDSGEPNAVDSGTGDRDWAVGQDNRDDDGNLQKDDPDEVAVIDSGVADAGGNGPSAGSVQKRHFGVGHTVSEDDPMDWTTDRRRIALASPDWQFRVSHLVFRVRAMTAEEFLALVEDVRQYGLRNPIIRWKGEIVDGLHRLLACLEAGVEPGFRTSRTTPTRWPMSGQSTLSAAI